MFIALNIIYAHVCVKMQQPLNTAPKLRRFKEISPKRYINDWISDVQSQTEALPREQTNDRPIPPRQYLTLATTPIEYEAVLIDCRRFTREMEKYTKLFFDKTGCNIDCVRCLHGHLNLDEIKIGIWCINPDDQADQTAVHNSLCGLTFEGHNLIHLVTDKPFKIKEEHRACMKRLILRVWTMPNRVKSFNSNRRSWWDPDRMTARDVRRMHQYWLPESRQIDDRKINILSLWWTMLTETKD